MIRKPAVKPRLAPTAVKGRIAIVLDDWGYNLNNLPIIAKINYPLTVAILPNIAYSERVSRELHAKGFEVILHLPMQPQEPLNLEENTIMVSLDKQEILNILDQDLASITYAKGVSNHMGSMATSDRRTMEIVLGELKRRHLYFLDSFVTSTSVCFERARKLNLVAFRRDVFLDNVEEAGYIKKQINILKNKARIAGFAIGIGHDRRVTLEVLREVMPKLAREGYKFIFLSDLTRGQKR